MSPRFLLKIAFAAVLSVVLSAACSASKGTTGGGSSGSSSSGSGASDAGTDAPSGVTLRINPTSASATVTLGVPASPVTFHAYATVGGGMEQDVTSTATWSVDANIASISAGVADLKGNGGKATVSATFQGATTSAPLAVMLTGDVFGPGASPAIKPTFGSATPDPTPANAPAIEYPEDGVVLPGNLPPIDAQWTQVSDNTAYRVHLTSPGLLDVYFYTASLDLVFDTAAWGAVAATTPDAPTQMTVDALGGGGTKLRTSAPRTLTIASDGIDKSAIYVWQSSSGTFKVLDIVAGTEIALPNNEPALASGQPCSGCHRISRDGARFAYTYNGANFEFGALSYDATKGLFATKIAPSQTFRGTYATFNPNEALEAPAMLLAMPDNVPENAKGTVRLGLVSPDTGAPITSNIATAISSIDAAVGHATSMPDWSPDGSFVVFAAYDSDANQVRLLGDDIVAASIVEVPVSYSGSTGFTFGTPRTLVKAAAGAAASPDTGENNFLPSISPDGSAVAFTRASGWWSLHLQTSMLNLSGQIVLVRRSDGQVLPLVKGSNGPGTTLNSTWPQWAPTMGSRYAWLAYGSERPYGHLLTATSPQNAQCGFVSGQKLCKHLWVTAIDRAKLGAGTDDPSSPPFWIPVQALAAQYVSPQWTKAVIAPIQ